MDAGAEEAAADTAADVDPGVAEDGAVVVESGDGQSTEYSTADMEAGRATFRGGCIPPAISPGWAAGAPTLSSTRPAMARAPTFLMCTQLVRALRGAWRTALGPTVALTQATILANAGLLLTAPGVPPAESQP